MLVRGNIFGVISLGTVVTADDVVETASRVFVSPQQKSDLDELINNAEVIAGTVNTFADLPDVVTSVGQKWKVETATGVWGINRKPAGTYLSTGTIWTSQYNAVDVINSLASTQTQKALSANQGRILNETKLNGVQAGDRIDIDNSSPNELNPIISAIVSLQDAYNQGVSILVDNTLGQIIFSAIGRTVAPFRIEPNATVPSTNLSNGDIYVGSDGTVYIYDSSRSKFLSTNILALQYGNNGNTDNGYLRFGGNVLNGAAGARLLNNSTIIGISIQAANAASKNIDIEVNGANVQTVATVGGVLSLNNLNIDVNANDRLMLFAQAAGPAINGPCAIVFLKRRAA